MAELINTFDTFLKEHIILGFNSGKYDLNVVKPLIIKHLRPRISFTIPKNNDFMCLKTDIFKFLDIKNYIAPGFEKRTHFYNNLHLWLPAQACDDHRRDFIANKVRGLASSPQPCCLERQRYDKRTPGLFKLE